MQYSDVAEVELRECEEAIRSGLMSAQSESIVSLTQMLADMHRRGNASAAAQALRRRPGLAALVFDSCCQSHGKVTKAALQLVHGILLLDTSLRASKVLAHCDAVRRCLQLAEDTNETQCVRQSALRTFVLHTATSADARIKAESEHAMHRLALLAAPTSTHSNIEKQACTMAHILAGWLHALGTDDATSLRKQLGNALQSALKSTHKASVIMGEADTSLEYGSSVEAISHSVEGLVHELFQQ